MNHSQKIYEEEAKSLDSTRNRTISSSKVRTISDLSKIFLLKILYFSIGSYIYI